MQNDLVLFYKVGKVNIIEVIVANVPSVLEVLPAGNRKRDFIEIVSYAWSLLYLHWCFKFY